MATKKQPTKKTISAFVADWLKTYTFDISTDRVSVIDLAIDECIEAATSEFECDLTEKTIELISSLIDASLAVEPASEVDLLTKYKNFVIFDNSNHDELVNYCDSLCQYSLVSDDNYTVVIDEQSNFKAKNFIAPTVNTVNYTVPVNKPLTAAQALKLLMQPANTRDDKAAEIVRQPATIDIVIELQNEVHLDNGVTLRVNPNVNTNMRTGLPVKYNIVPPKRAGKCYDVWVKCNELLSQGVTPTSGLIDAWSINNGYNVQNGRIELYRFLKYYGIAKSA
jgi:hypothetical protein